MTWQLLVIVRVTTDCTLLRSCLLLNFGGRALQISSGVQSLSSGFRLIVIGSRHTLSDHAEGAGHPNSVEQAFSLALSGLNIFQNSCDMILKPRHPKELVAVVTITRADLKTGLKDIMQVLGVTGRNGVIFASDDFSVEAFHGGSAEWRHLGDHFVEDAAEGPNVRPMIIRHVLPHLGASVVWRASLGSQHATLCDFAHIQVTELHDTFLRQKDVCTLDVSVANFQVVESLESSNDLNEVVPDGFLTDLFSLFLLF